MAVFTMFPEHVRIAQMRRVADKNREMVPHKVPTNKQRTLACLHNGNSGHYICSVCNGTIHNDEAIANHATKCWDDPETGERFWYTTRKHKNATDCLLQTTIPIASEFDKNAKIPTYTSNPYGHICNKCGNNARLTGNRHPCPVHGHPLTTQACSSYISVGDVA